MRIATALLLAPAVALADAPQLDRAFAPTPRLSFLQDDGTPVAEPDMPAAPADTTGDTARDTDYEVSFRGRMMSVPDSMLDIWYFDSDDGTWTLPEDRPRIRGYALGLEFVVKSGNANGLFYLEYVKSLVAEGYWDDREEPADHLDGDYLVPSSNLSLAVFGANYAYEAHLVKTADTNGAFGLSFLVGGGLGVAYMIGDLDRWAPADGTTNCPAGSPAYVCYESGFDQVGTKSIPRVYPMVDINAGLRFNFGDRLVLRVEGGLHTMLYYGATLGVMF